MTLKSPPVPDNPEDWDLVHLALFVEFVVAERVQEACNLTHEVEKSATLHSVIADAIYSALYACFQANSNDDAAAYVNKRILAMPAASTPRLDRELK